MPTRVRKHISLNLSKHKREWDTIGEMDPYWAILSDPKHKYGKWSPDEFLQSGEMEVERIMESLRGYGYPLVFSNALDFGCGVGRVTRFLARYVENVVGSDISTSMIEKARALNHDVANCSFVVNEHDDLSLFRHNCFDLIYSNIVLQHLPSKESIYDYVSEFIRVLKPGGLLIFQLPGLLPIVYKLQLRRTLYLLLNRLGVKEEFLYWKLGLHPLRMRGIKKELMIAFVESKAAVVLDVKEAHDHYFPLDSCIYYIRKI